MAKSAACLRGLVSLMVSKPLPTSAMRMVGTQRSFETSASKTLVNLTAMSLKESNTTQRNYTSASNHHEDGEVEHDKDAEKGKQEGVGFFTGKRYAVEIADPTPLQELDYILGTLPTIDMTKKEDFMELFEKSPFVKIGNKVENVSVEGVVKFKDSQGLMVDFGGKFPARIAWRKSDDPSQYLEIGDWLVIDLRDLERSEHLLGDAKPVTIHRALARYNHQATIALKHTKKRK